MLDLIIDFFSLCKMYKNPLAGGRMLESYGAMTVLLSYLTQMQGLFLQSLNKFSYNIGVGRVQLKIQLDSVALDAFYFLNW